MYSDLPNWIDQKDVLADDIECNSVKTKTLEADNATIGNINIEDVSLDDLIVNTLVVNSSANIPNYAKLNASNTFTHALTINNYDAGRTLSILDTTLGTNNTILAVLGKEVSNNNCATIRYTNSSPRVLDFGFANNDGILHINSNKQMTMNGTLKVTTNTDENLKIENSSQNDNRTIATFTCPNFNDGHYLQMNLCKNTNAGNGFYLRYYHASANSLSNYLGIGRIGYGEQLKIFGDHSEYYNLLRISTSSTDSSAPLKIFSPNLTTNKNLIMFFGKSETSENCAVIKYSNTAVPYLSFGFHSLDDIVKIDTDTNVTMANDVIVGNDLTVSGNVDASAYTIGENTISTFIDDDALAELTPEDDLNNTQFLTAKATLDLIKQEVMNTMYPIGSIYITTTELPGTKLISDNTPIIEWNGQIWTPMDSGRIVQNDAFTIQNDTWNWDNAPIRTLNGGNDYYTMRCYIYKRLM